MINQKRVDEIKKELEENSQISHDYTMDEKYTVLLFNKQIHADKMYWTVARPGLLDFRFDMYAASVYLNGAENV